MESWSPRENIDAAVEAIARGVARVRPGASETRSLETSAEPAAATDSTRSPAHKLSE
jgi:hypothetical protein